MWGMVLVCLSSARCLGLVCLVGLPVGIWWFLYRAEAHFPMFIGEVLSVFRCLWGLWLLVFFVFCGALPFW